eukprot:m.137882 g.137882  ORF g.137882 m.137882 type:complete len:348 (-) comp29955_c1_seq2:30-1073(-)
MASKMRMSAVVLTLLGLSSVSGALTPSTTNDEVILFPAGPPGEKPGLVGPEVVVPRTSHNGYVLDIVNNVSQPTITPFLAPNCQANCTAVVIAPGGAYKILAFNMEGTDVAKRFNAMGISAFVLKYRVPDVGVRGDPSLPFGWAPHQDAQRALGLIRSRAAEWKVDPNRLGFMGFSAGGHLTAHITTAWGHRTYPRIDAADDLPCRPDFSLLIYPWKLLLNNNASSMVLAPEVSNVSALTPPVFIAQNEDDPSAHVENSLMFYYKLKQSAHRTPVSAMHLYPKGGHGFGLCQTTGPGPDHGPPGFLECCDWPLAAQRFLQNKNLASGLPTSPCTGVYDADGSLTCHA